MGVVEDLGSSGDDLVAMRSAVAGAADPELAAHTLSRLAEALGDDVADLRSSLSSNTVLRTRLFALLGGSTALGDHLVAHPEQWRLLEKTLPEPDEVMRTMLDAVEAVPEPGSTANEARTAAGTYRAGETYFDGTNARNALRSAYRTLIMRFAAADLAGTFASTNRGGDAQPMMGYRAITHMLTVCADAALTAALAVAMRVVFNDDEADCSLAVLAMGKCGAGELNYISDVDVIFVAEPANANATKLASEFIKLGSACFFDVDANLRPEGKSGALVRTLDSHLAYYKRWAETWESVSYTHLTLPTILLV